MEQFSVIAGPLLEISVELVVSGHLLPLFSPKYSASVITPLASLALYLHNISPNNDY